jgi:hypothetical protein
MGNAAPAVQLPIVIPTSSRLFDAAPADAARVTP